MTPIKNISGEILAAERIRQQEKLASTKADRAKSRSGAAEGSSAVTRKDSVDISPAAQKLAETDSDTARFQDMLNSLRKENTVRIAEVRARIATGEYDSEEVVNQVAASIQNLPQFRAAATEQEAVTSRSEDVHALRDRVASGRYNSNAVLEQVAVRMLDDMGIV